MWAVTDLLNIYSSTFQTVSEYVAHIMDDHIQQEFLMWI